MSELSGSFDIMSLNSLKIIFSKKVIFDDACFNSLKSLSFSFFLLFLNFLRVTPPYLCQCLVYKLGIYVLMATETEGLRPPQP